MSVPYLAYFNDHLVGVVPLSGRFSEDGKDKIRGTLMLLKAMGFNTRLDYLHYLPGYLLEENPLKEYDTDIVFLSLKNKIGSHVMKVNFTCNTHHFNTYEFIVNTYNKTANWIDVEFYVQPKMEEVTSLPSEGELWYCSDWEG